MKILMKMDNLRTVTVMLQGEHFDRYTPEIDGEYNVERLGGRNIESNEGSVTTAGELIAEWKALHTKLYEEIKEKRKDWSIPRVKIRHCRAISKEIKSQG
jgi:hypothetical protein